jgi:hypothetical protein
MTKKVMMRIRKMEIALGIFSRFEEKSRTGYRIKERKMATKKGKSTGLASFKTTPAMKTTIIPRKAVAILLSFIGI